MKVKVELRDVFHCSLERAFETPILGDATKFLNGYRFQPPVVRFEDDSTWGEIGGVRYPVTNGNWLVPRGRIFTDEILERLQNNYWKWMIYEFQIPVMAFFAVKALGEWHVRQEAEGMISVRYSYTFYSRNRFVHLFTILFAMVQWRGFMKQALRGIKVQAESK